MKQEIKLIALDLDGTLLTNQKTITQRTKQVLSQAIKQGVIVMPATGRGLKAIPEEVGEIEGISYALTVNGAAVVEYKTGKVLYSDYLDYKTALEALDYGFTFDALPDIYIGGHAYSQKERLNNVEHYMGSLTQKEMIVKSRIPVDDLREFVKSHQEKIEKVNVIFHDMSEREKAYEYWKKNENLTVTCSMDNNLELNSKTATKGKALLAFAKTLGISPEEIMVCGDSNNDFEMIQMAGLGVAMGNAIEEIKQVANFITKTNEEDGVAYAVEQFVLKQK